MPAPTTGAYPISCRHCSAVPALVDGLRIYPHRPDLKHKNFYLCSCGAYVGCHPGTVTPLGPCVNAEIRAAKIRAHAAFDPIWKDGLMKRSALYEYLAGALCIPKASTHIGWFDVETCARVVVICKALRARIDPSY